MRLSHRYVDRYGEITLLYNVWRFDEADLQDAVARMLRLAVEEQAAKKEAARAVRAERAKQKREAETEEERARRLAEAREKRREEEGERRAAAPQKG